MISASGRKARIRDFGWVLRTDNRPGGSNTLRPGPLFPNKNNELQSLLREAPIPRPLPKTALESGR